MNKTMGIVVALCLALFAGMALAGCGAGIDRSLYEGDWILVSSTSEELDEASLQLMDELGMQVTMTLNDDGTGVLRIVDVNSDLTWEPESNNEAKGTMDESAITFSLNDGKLTLRDESNVSMTFARHAAQADGEEGSGGSAQASSASESSAAASASSASSAQSEMAETDGEDGAGASDVADVDETATSAEADSAEGEGAAQ